MSYDISLLDPVTKEVIEFDKPHQMKGGTYEDGGTNHAWLNITYNYAKHYSGIGEKGVRSIYGMTGAESIPVLEREAAKLADDVDEDYWNATEGNAKRALMQLEYSEDMVTGKLQNDREIPSIRDLHFQNSLDFRTQFAPGCFVDHKFIAHHENI